MAYVKKAEHEKEFVNLLLGVETYSLTNDNEKKRGEEMLEKLTKERDKLQIEVTHLAPKSIAWHAMALRISYLTGRIDQITIFGSRA